ncbi:YjbH domain-containing protein [Enterobacteriaceae bacterium LUAb1]
MKKHYFFSLLSLSAVNLCQAQVPFLQEPAGASQSDFGGVGLMQTPTARMAREGEFSVNARDNKQYHFYSTSIQLFPWLESTLRYTDIRNRRYSTISNFSGTQSYKDKSFDLKLRLWKEGYWMPETAVGVRDLGGTGLFNSEYLVASKASGPFDFTIGMGWGYLGNSSAIRNPFCHGGNRFCYRNQRQGSSGSLNSNQLFHGPVALFGGIEYQTPWQPLRLKVEYEGNDYRSDFAHNIRQDSKINAGAIYRIAHWADVSLSYERGNTLMAGVTLRTNFNDIHPAWTDKPEPTYRPLPQDEFMQYTSAAELLLALKEDAGYNEPRLQIKNNQMYLTGEQSLYRDSRKGVDRANRIMMNRLPANITTLNVTETRLGMAQVTTQTDVKTLRQLLEGYPLGHKKTVISKRINPVEPERAEQGYYIEKDRFHYSFSPVLNQSVGGPESFYMYQLGVLGNVDVWVTDHTLLGGSVFANLTNNYNKFNYVTPPDDTHLPRVRTHIRQYVQNDFYLDNLQANYFRYFGHGVYGQLYGGYLESMFGGAGAELLYRPLDADWALGIDANYVKQRDWDDMMKFTDYKTPTGHLALYWQPWFIEGVLIKGSIGQYLAKDKGGTIDISKRFHSGIIVGSYASITNASHYDYGEGRFTKGFYISVPIDLFTGMPNRSRAQVGWTPLTRDGGQKLGRKYQLYDMTSERSVK